MTHADQSELMDEKDRQFLSWWKASKYCQVVFPKDGWEQIARDGWNAAIRESTHRAEPAGDSVSKWVNKIPANIKFIDGLDAHIEANGKRFTADDEGLKQAILTTALKSAPPETEPVCMCGNYLKDHNGYEGHPFVELEQKPTDDIKTVIEGMRRTLNNTHAITVNADKEWNACIDAILNRLQGKQ